MITHFYDFKARSLQGEEIDFSAYKGQVILVVNTASQCGFTPQYEGLQELHEKYQPEGLTILAFPCNQFGKQEPGTADEIARGCLVNYGVSFQVFDKVAVNGAQAHPVFRFLKRQLPGVLGGRIKWNFTKFLLDRDGVPVKRFAPMTKPEKIEQDILNLLSSEATF
ncbi:glutathione peroxidase [Sunxiuqinia elliptica]|uniref:Glutathione peroxidase n=1 Tax=Sunxiuqinia elliptica TaxID=655355 RepID=A0A1I2IKV6_9BACT|nr:glutathione peroxidase [Sunxiuqinia elliptica]SFF42945.1 glutathione peroxidase [Sunxiuqinia elliptica]